MVTRGLSIAEPSSLVITGHRWSSLVILIRIFDYLIQALEFFYRIDCFVTSTALLGAHDFLEVSAANKQELADEWSESGTLFGSGIRVNKL